jgi:GNAT superfamily N-acetyltransferase
MMETFQLTVSPPLENNELNELFQACWPDHVDQDYSDVLKRSLAYVCARDGDRLVGFVYIAWDGRDHAFLLDPTVHPAVRRRGLGLELVKRVEQVAREGGCKWLHVDYEPELESFYHKAGYRPTKAGLIRLRD